MSEETTGNLNDRNSFESQVPAALAAVNNQLSGVENRLTALETKVDRLEAQVGRLEAKVDRLGTRVGGLEARMTALEEKVDRGCARRGLPDRPRLAGVELIDGKLDILNHDILTMRAEVDRLKKRQPPAA